MQCGEVFLNCIKQRIKITYLLARRLDEVVIGLTVKGYCLFVGLMKIYFLYKCFEGCFFLKKSIFLLLLCR